MTLMHMQTTNVCVLYKTGSAGMLLPVRLVRLVRLM